jgi:hypothetical protein
MATITFDTHKFITKLEAGGFTSQQAEALAYAILTALQEHQTTQSNCLPGISFKEIKADLLRWVAFALAIQAAVIVALVKLL